MGMANYFGKFSPHLTLYICPVKDVFSEQTKWCWEAPQKEAFQTLKAEPSSPRALAPYSPAAETFVSADASSYGLGGVPGHHRQMENGGRQCGETHIYTGGKKQ